MSEAVILPSQITERVVAFLRAGGTGKLQLDISQGRIVGWQLTEGGRIGERQIEAKSAPVCTQAQS